MLKGIAAHYVMQADDRVAVDGRASASCSPSWWRCWRTAGPSALERPFADDWDAAADDAARLRVVIDQVASLTDASAVALHEPSPNLDGRDHTPRLAARSTPTCSATRRRACATRSSTRTDDVPDSVGDVDVLRAAVPGRLGGPTCSRG